MALDPAFSIIDTDCFQAGKEPGRADMKVILFGATGMVGQGVLRECLLDERVEAVLAVGRKPSGQAHPKLRDFIRNAFST